jgi:hypothetical protein
VQHPDPHLLDLDDAALWQKAPQLRLVGVSVDGLHRRPERLQLLECREARDVAGVQDQVRDAEELDAAIGKSASATWQMCIRNDGEACQPTPFRNRPSR